MKTYLSLLACLLCIGAAQAQTNVQTQTIWDLLTTGSNYWAAPFFTVSTGDHEVGGGLAIGYLATEAINPMIRFDYFAGAAWMVSGNIQLQPPRRLMGKVPVIPFAIAGVGTPFSGGGELNGRAIGIVGIGAAIKLDFLSSTSTFLRHLDIAFDYEHWSGMPELQQNQVRGAVVFKF